MEQHFIKGSISVDEHALKFLKAQHNVMIQQHNIIVRLHKKLVMSYFTIGICITAVFLLAVKG